MTTKRTAPQVRSTLRQIGDKLPDRTNPLVDGSCVYTSPDDPTQHCIAGEVAVRLKVPLPDPYSDANSQPLMSTDIHHHFTAPALTILRAAQRCADLQLTRWGTAIEYALSEDVAP